MRIMLALLLALSGGWVSAQAPQLLSGPMQGGGSGGAAQLWLMGSHFDSVLIHGEEAALTAVGDSLFVAKATLEGLPPGRHQIPIRIKGGAGHPPLVLQKEIYVPTAKAEDFSFLLGSCTFPYKPKSKRWHIFDKMAEMPTDFMLWMGDNIYLLFGDWNSRARINRRYVRYRKNKHLKAFLASRPNFAAWDDHDFGPNDSDSSFPLKDTTLQAFKDFWANPAYGTDSLPGTFYSFRWQDAAFFVLDGRYYKTDGQMYGPGQMRWLKEGLRNCDAAVKFIVGGSQFLVTPKLGEDWGDYPEEKEDFLNFVKAEKLEGIVFLSGDRHFAELTVVEDWGGPKLLEMTASPLTSFLNPTIMKRNPHRLKGSLAKKRNFGKISLSGQGGNRKMEMELFDKKGRPIWKHAFLLQDLK